MRNTFKQPYGPDPLLKISVPLSFSDCSNRYCNKFGSHKIPDPPADHQEFRKLSLVCKSSDYMGASAMVVQIVNAPEILNILDNNSFLQGLY